MTVIDAATGEDLESFSATWGGSDGSWAVAIAPDGCVWSGGAFTSGPRADGERVFAGNLIRTCPITGPKAHGIQAITPTPPPELFACVVEPTATGAMVSWADLGASGYDLIEDGDTKRWVRGTEATDLSPGTQYEVVAWGNGTSGTRAVCDNPAPGGGAGFVCTVERINDRTIQVSWTDLGARGYDVIEDGNAKRWTTAASLLDPSPGSTYKIVAWGNGVSGESTEECINPEPGGGLEFVCSITDQPDGTRLISWTDLGARGYDVFEDAEPKRWTRGVELVDATPGQSYSVVAWGNGYAGERVACAGQAN
jgi:hypothetical protein